MMYPEEIDEYLRKHASGIVLSTPQHETEHQSFLSTLMVIRGLLGSHSGTYLTDWHRKGVEVALKVILEINETKGKDNK